MRREDLEHVIRAAAAVSGCSDIVVIGSQAILAQHPNAPAALLFSQETDVYPREDPERAIYIDGAMGDGSQFHETFGYYAHGIGPETVTAPTGWEARLVPVRVIRAPASDGEATGWCLEAHDLVLAKCAAGRERDWEFAREAMLHRLVESDELLRRVSDLPLDDSRQERLRALLVGVIAATSRNVDVTRSTSLE